MKGRIWFGYAGKQKHWGLGRKDEGGKVGRQEIITATPAPGAGFDLVWCFRPTTGFAAAEVTGILGFGMPSFLAEGSWTENLAQFAVLDLV